MKLKSFYLNFLGYRRAWRSNRLLRLLLPHLLKRTLFTLRALLGDRFLPLRKEGDLGGAPCRYN